MKFIEAGLEIENSEILTVVVEGITKCFLFNSVQDDDFGRFLLPLILLYFHPGSNDSSDSSIRQCLSFFFNAFTKSSRDNQIKIQRIFIKAMSALEELSLSLGTSALNLPNCLGQMLEWTDQRSLLEPIENDSEYSHVGLAIQGLELAMIEEPVSFRKHFCQLLPKLYIPEYTEKCSELRQVAQEILYAYENTELFVAKSIEKYLLID